MLNPADLPPSRDIACAIPCRAMDDIATLKALLVASEGRNLRKQDRIDQLEKLVADFKRSLFGVRSEKADPEQFELALEDIETAMAAVHAEDVALDPPTSRVAKPRNTNRGSLPKHLLRIEEVIAPDSATCGCGAERHVIGEDTSERLDIISAQFRVIVTRRPKYACRSCTNGVVQAPAPARLIPGGMPTEATVAHVPPPGRRFVFAKSPAGQWVSEYANHLTLYRQAQIYSRQGIDLDRSTLAGWVGNAVYELRPVFDALTADLKQSTKLFMDETRAPVLDPGKRKTKTGYFWALARDDRSWAGAAPPGVAFTYAPGRSGQYADGILKGFSGILQVEGYAGYNRLLKRADDSVALAYCRAHARRKLHEVAQSRTAPITEEGLKQIAALYRIEKDIRGLAAEERLAARKEQSAPLIANFEAWLTAHRTRVSAKAPMGEALKYITKYWEGPRLFLADGRIEMDSTPWSGRSGASP